MLVTGLGVVGLGVTVLGNSAATPTQVQAMIVNAAGQYSNVPNLAQVALAVAQHESAFNPNVKNDGSSAAGVYQLINMTQQTLGVSNPYDPAQNVDAGVGLLASYYQKYGDWTRALQAFSDGQGTVANGLPPSAQTVGLVNYVNGYDAGPILAQYDTGGGNFDSGGSVFGTDQGQTAMDAGVMGGIDVAEAVGLGITALIAYQALS